MSEYVVTIVRYTIGRHTILEASMTTDRIGELTFPSDQFPNSVCEIVEHSIPLLGICKGIEAFTKDGKYSVTFSKV